MLDFERRLIGLGTRFPFGGSLLVAAQKSMWIPFNKPYLTGRELEYIRQAHEAHHLSGDGAVHQALPAPGSSAPPDATRRC